MLRLTRKEGQTIKTYLPDGRVIVIEVSRIKGSYISLGIDAPPDVRIIRSELEDEQPCRR